MPSSLEYIVYVDKTTEVVTLPPVTAVLNNIPLIINQEIFVSACMRNDTYGGIGELLIDKVSNLDQPRSVYANWIYTFNFNSLGPLGEGSVIASINLINGTAWSNPSNINNNPSEIIPAGLTSQTYVGQILSGTGPYYGVSGKLIKTKDASSVREYDLQMVLL